MTNFEFMEKAQAKVNECWNKLNKCGFAGSVPTIDFALKGRAAGVATDGGRRISINLVFVHKYADDMLEQTIPHEVVHCWLTQTGDPSHVGWGRRSPHGYTFMKTLASLGCRTERTHSYESDVPPSNRSTRKYHCPTCGKIYWITEAKHRKIQRGAECWCRSCGRGRGNIVQA